MSNETTPPSAGRGRGRGRGYGVDRSPLRKPTGDSRNSSRPGSTTQSPRSNSSPSTLNRTEAFPKVTMSDSSIGASNQRTLDASAAVFVPKLVKSLPALSVSAVEFVPANKLQAITLKDYEILIDNLELMLQELLDYPSRYEQSIPNIADYLKASFTDATSMTVTTDVIFEWALTNKNFSYTCGRICQNIHDNVPNSHNGTFNQHMLKRCHTEYMNIETLLKGDPGRVCAFALFMAELYTKNVGRVRKVLEALLNILQRIISILNDDLSVPVVQVLKMCGACLEDDLLNNGEGQVLDDLLAEMKRKITCGAVSQRNSGMLMSVITLRASNWGRSTSPAASPAATPSPMPDYSQEPVFFNTSGQRITREEAGYGVEGEYSTIEEDVQAVGSQMGQWSIHDGQYVPTNTDDSVTGGAAGDFSEIEDYINGGDEDDLDIVVIDDDDEQMTEDMWSEFERFESERDKDLQNYHDQHETD